MLIPSSQVKKLYSGKVFLIITLTFAFTCLNAQDRGRPSDAYPDSIEEPSEFEKKIEHYFGIAGVIGILIGIGYLWGQYNYEKNKYFPMLDEIEKYKKDNAYAQKNWIMYYEEKVELDSKNSILIKELEVVSSKNEQLKTDLKTNIEMCDRLRARILDLRSQLPPDALELSLFGISPE